MPSEDKLIKSGIQYTDRLFKEIKRKITHDLENSKDLEEFLTRTDQYLIANPLVTTGYSDTMSRLVAQATLNTRFARARQRQLVRTVIQDRVGHLITNVGEDLKQNVRDIVKAGYDEGLHSREIAKNIEKEIDTLNRTRARTIARTEIARTQTISDYIVNKERGATSYSVVCRPDCCEYCAEVYADLTGDEYEKLQQEVEEGKNNGQLIGGEKTFSMDNVDDLPPYHPNSYHKDTQVYTENGWRYIADLTGNEKLLSLNPDDESLEFIKPVRLFKHKEPELVHMHNKWFDVCVTLDHDCFIHQRRDGGKKGRYFEPQFRKPHELTAESRFLRCIDTDRVNPDMININGVEFTPEDFAFFMAWFISEGSVLHDKDKAKKRGYPIFIAQEISENREIIQPILENICNYLGLRLNITKNQFVIYSKELYDYLLPLGYSYEKYIPSEVFTLNKQCLNIFLDNYVCGDGHERMHKRYNSLERSVYTSSPQLKDDLSYLILLCGFCPSIWIHSKKGTEIEHHNGTYTQNYDIYGIRINNSRHTIYSSLNVDVIPYDDYTYCVELPKYHTLWVMRNGKTSWNGNCRCSVNYNYDTEYFDDIRSQIHVRD